MILRLIKKSNLGQTERSYARAVMEYIATPEVALLNESGHKKDIVEKCSHYEVHGCTPGLDLRHQVKLGIFLHTGTRKRELLDARWKHIEIGCWRCLYRSRISPQGQRGTQCLPYFPIASLLDARRIYNDKFPDKEIYLIFYDTDHTISRRGNLYEHTH